MTGGSNPRIGVHGAGAIGAYLGLRLSAAGVPVTLVGRPALVAQRAELAAGSFGSEPVRPGADLTVTTEVEALRAAAVVLVTVKSQATVAAGHELANVLDDAAVVVSFQNGLGNAERLRAAGVRARVVPGMVAFNVVREGPVFRKATSGTLMSGPVPADLVAAFRASGEALEVRDDLEAVLTSKLLLNLNNGLCAVTGLPIAAAVADRDLRWCFVQCLREGLTVMQAAGRPLARIGRLSPPLVARLLGVPDVLFRRLAGSFMGIDPRARSSTLQDLELGKRTEIDFLNGEIVRLGQAHGQRTPANAWVTRTVHAHEAAAPNVRFLSASETRAAMRRAIAEDRPPLGDA